MSTEKARIWNIKASRTGWLKCHIFSIDDDKCGIHMLENKSYNGIISLKANEEYYILNDAIECIKPD